ncbi:MAG: hypothetical protein WBM39_10485 [Parasphingorhabdus sp.]
MTREKIPETDNVATEAVMRSQIAQQLGIMLIKIETLPNTEIVAIRFVEAISALDEADTA